MKLKEGTKFDTGKPRMDLISGYALLQVGRVCTYGAVKYDDHNWRKGIKWSRIIAAMFRHLVCFMMGETYDEESGLHHLSHLAWGCFVLLEYSITRPDYDDRYIFTEDEINQMVTEGRAPIKIYKEEDSIHDKPESKDHCSSYLNNSNGPEPRDTVDPSRAIQTPDKLRHASFGSGRSHID